MLDVMMPGISGLDMIASIARGFAYRSDPGHPDVGQEPGVRRRSPGIAPGAVDYIIKPFSPRELVDRVDAVLRAERPVTSAVLPDNRDSGRRPGYDGWSPTCCCCSCWCGTAGVAAIQIATNQIGRLTTGYTPANDAHSQALTLMLDAETAVRGYLLTGNPGFLKPYRESRPKIMLSLDRPESALHASGCTTWDPAIANERAVARTVADPIRRPDGGEPDPNKLPSRRSKVAGKEMFDQFRAADCGGQLR